MAGKIVVLGTGGTIAGTSDVAGASVGYTAGQLGIEQLLAAVPQLAQAARGPLVAEQLAQVDSKDMDTRVWASLVARCTEALAQEDVRGVVVTHGTDTLEETAYLLHRCVPASKPVVLTCAMRPATALSPDGPQNLADALLVAAQEGARGVLLACAGRVHAAVGLRKVHPYRLDPFESGEGVVGYVEDSRWRAARDWPAAASASVSLPDGEWPWVAIVVSHAGADARQVDALVHGGVRGLVVSGTGNGTVHHALATALRNASARGVRVVRTTRCAEGVVVDGGRDAEFETLPLTPVQARVELQLQLLAA